MTEALLLAIKPVRYARKVTDGAGLHLLVTPDDHRYWRYQYRFEGRQKTLALGVYPDVSLQTARRRHFFARRLLADGIDPSTFETDARETRVRGGRSRVGHATPVKDWQKDWLVRSKPGSMIWTINSL